MNQEIQIGQGTFKYWLGPGGVFPHPVPGYVQRGGAFKYLVDGDGVLWRHASMAPCGTEFNAIGEFFPNQAGLPSALYGRTNELYDQNVVIGAGAPDCSTLPPMDPDVILRLLEDAIATTQNQAIFLYLNKLRESSVSEIETLTGNDYIAGLASQIRRDIIEKFENYRYIKDIGHFLRIYTADQSGAPAFRLVMLNTKSGNYECLAKSLFTRC